MIISVKYIEVKQNSFVECWRKKTRLVWFCCASVIDFSLPIRWTCALCIWNIKLAWWSIAWFRREIYCCRDSIFSVIHFYTDLWILLLKSFQSIKWKVVCFRRENHNLFKTGNDNTCTCCCSPLLRFMQISCSYFKNMKWFWFESAKIMCSECDHLLQPKLLLIQLFNPIHYIIVCKNAPKNLTKFYTVN